MPHLKRSRSSRYEDKTFDPLLHEPGTNGRDNVCSVRYCGAPPVISRRWFPPDYPDGWMACYCQSHAHKSAARAAKSE